MKEKISTKYVISIQEYDTITNEKYKYDAEITLICDSLDEAKEQFDEKVEMYVNNKRTDSYLSFILYEVVSNYTSIETKVLN